MKVVTDTKHELRECVNNVFCFIGNVRYGTLTSILGLLFAKDSTYHSSNAIL